MRSIALRELTTWLTRRPSSAHKGSAGRVLIVAGSRGMPGAAILASLGAVRSGAGLVRVGIVKSQMPIVAKRAPLEVTSVGWLEDRFGQLTELSWKGIQNSLKQFRPDIIALGPGLGQSKGVQTVVKKVLTKQSVPVVLDADGLNVLASMKVKMPCRPPMVLTPHVGEMSRLIRHKSSWINKNRLKSAIMASKKYKAVVLLKGKNTLVTDGRRVWENPTGNAAMATGGMGDVLTGIVASTWAQMKTKNLDSAFQAAALGSYIHGLAGDVASKKYPERSLLASDAAHSLPHVFKILWRRKSRKGRK